MFRKHHCTLCISKQTQLVSMITEITLNQRNIERLSGFKPYALMTALFCRQSVIEIEILK